MQLKFFVPLAFALVSSVSAATVPTVDLTPAREACANGEILHSSSFMFEGQEVKMTTQSCPGMHALTGGAEAAPAPAGEPSENIFQCASPSCTLQCYVLNPWPTPFGDCVALSNALAANAGTFPAPSHSITTWNVNKRCIFNYYNFDIYNYDVCFSTFASIGYNTANVCINQYARGAGNCFASGAFTDAWAVEFLNPFNT